MIRRLYRSNKNKVVAGIIGGIGEYFDIDPVILRLGYVLLTAISGFLPCIVAYIIAMLVVPKPPHSPEKEL